MRDRHGNRGAFRAVLLATLALSLAGCDVIVVGLLASRSKKSSSSSAPAPDTTYKVFVRSLGATTPELDAEAAILVAAGGAPAAPWVLAGSGTASQVFDVSGLAGPFTAVLIQAPEAQDYRIDAIELLDANGVVIETAVDASIRANLLTSPKTNAESTPDGKTADTDSTATEHAFLFVRFATSVSVFHATLAGSVRVGGDIEFALSLPRGGDQLSGGVAVASSGLVVLPFVDSSTRNVILSRIAADGGSATNTVVEADTNVTGGLPCALVDDSRDRVYISYLRAPALTSEENLRVSRYSLATPGAATTVTELAVLGVERVEANSLALNAIGELMIAGGRPGLLGGLSPWLRKVNVADTEVWTTPTAATGTGNYFFGVATDAPGNVFAVGDVNTAAGDWQIQRYDSAGNPTPASPRTEGSTGLDRALAVATDGNFVYVGGFFDRSGLIPSQGRNGLLFKYNAADLTPVGGAFPIEINGFGNGNDEILDVAADGGEVFVVGYTTVSSPAQGENWFVRKYSSDGTLLWEKIYHHGFGNDRAVSVAVKGDIVVVAGEVTISGGSTDLHVRRYVR